MKHAEQDLDTAEPRSKLHVAEFYLDGQTAGGLRSRVAGEPRPPATVANPFRITRTQPGKPRLQTPFDLRCVRHPLPTGFHDDRTASLQLYDDGRWYCYGACKAGGSIFDFAARTWRMDAKGRAFLKLRARLADELELDARAS
jgi:hypothetical protein